MTLFDKKTFRVGAWKNNSILNTHTHNIEKCRESSPNGETRPIWNMSTWNFLRESYRKILGEEESTITQEQEGGLVIPYEINHTTKKGRGIYAISQIKAGDLVWCPTHHAVFRREKDFQLFLSALSYDLACDVLMWAYVERCDCVQIRTDNGRVQTNSRVSQCYAAAFELDDGSFMNGISSGESPTVGFDQKEFNRTGKAQKHFALRDIDPGEEIIVDYDTFDISGKLHWFDDMVDNAWWEGTDDSDDDDYEAFVMCENLRLVITVTLREYNSLNTHRPY